MSNLSLAVFIGISQVFAQTGNFWHVLAEVHFVTVKDAGGYTIEKPVFSKNLKSFNGKEITLKGYMIPLEETGGGKFMLSSQPFNICYFCGAAGPETVVEVEIMGAPKFTTGKITLQGILALNESDPDRHIYILKSASGTD